MCTYYFFGAGHLLFGSDMPHGAQLGGQSIEQGIEGIEQMDISDREKQMIFKENALRLLRLPI